MKNKRAGIWSILLALSIIGFPGAAACGQGEGGNSKSSHKIVYIHAERGIEPREAAVSQGTTVIWLNNSDYRLQLKFTGRQVSTACAAPVNFSLDGGFFISTGIPLGGVASLCFVQKGVFEYQLIQRDQYGAPSKPERFKGIIKVQ